MSVFCRGVLGRVVLGRGVLGRVVLGRGVLGRGEVSCAIVRVVTTAYTTRVPSAANTASLLLHYHVWSPFLLLPGRDVDVSNNSNGHRK